MSTVQFTNLRARGDVGSGMGGASGGTNTMGSYGAGSSGGFIYLEPKAKLDGQTAGQIYAPGMVIQTATVSSSRNRQSVYGDNLVSIPELSISFACVASTSWLLMQANIQSTGQHVSSYGFMANGSVIYANTNTNSNGSVSTTYFGDDDGNYMRSYMIMSRYLPGTTGAITYTVGASASWSGGLRTLYLNDRVNNDMRGTSSFTIMEIAV